MPVPPRNLDQTLRNAFDSPFPSGSITTIKGGLIDAIPQIFKFMAVNMTIQSAFDNYIAILAENRELKREEDGRLYILRSRTSQIRALVERCECTSQFRRFVKETRAAYAKHPDREGDDRWQTSVTHVLRRSRIYAAAFDGDHSPNELFKRFTDALTEVECTAVFLAPLESVEFSADRPLHFGSFQIRKFSREELSTITENDTRELFYPESVLDIGLLSQYWWLFVPYAAKPDCPGKVFKIDISRPPIERRYSRFPERVEHVLKTLVLYDWHAKSATAGSNPRRYSLLEDHRRWLGFRLPFVMRCGGRLFGPPVQPPDTSRLALQPFFNDDDEEIGLCPQTPIHYLRPNETRTFSRIVAEIEKQLKKIRTQTDEWSFIDVATSHLVKAFFAYELDQLLWHTVAIEALLGERGPSLTNTLARRCGSVLGCTKTERTRIRDSLRKIYDLRSDVVHGNTKLREIHDGHLSVARFIARDVTVWILKYLCHVAKGILPNDECLPHRRELLSALDGRPEVRKRISHLFNRVPVDFPSSACWDKP